jgi:type II secretory pathway pseudopilin PulG
MSPARGDKSQSGMTMVELLLLTAIMSLACYSFTRFIQSTRQAAGRQDAAGELLQRNLRTVTNLRAGLQGCVELLANYGDSTGDALLPLHSMILASVSASASTPSTALGAPYPVSFSGWPTVETASEVDMVGPSDPGAVVWGDEIMYVAELNPITFTAYYTQSGSNWIVGTASSNTSTNAEVLSVQRLQFVYDYLSWDSRTWVAGSGRGLRLTEWRSQPVIDYSSLSSLTDAPGTYTSSACCPRLAAACAYLTSAGYTMAYQPSNATMTSNCSTCFYPLSPESAVAGSGATPIALPATLPMYSWAYLDDYDLVQSYGAKPNVDLGRISRADGNSGGQTSAPGGYSVALDTSTTASSTSVIGLQGPGGPLQVPAYAQAGYVLPTADGGPQGGTGFPGGFEVAIDGQVGSREIYMRVVLLASNGGTNTYSNFQALPESTEISVAPQSDF